MTQINKKCRNHKNETQTENLFRERVSFQSLLWKILIKLL
jgi:hypothetical protein